MTAAELPLPSLIVQQIARDQRGKREFRNDIVRERFVGVLPTVLNITIRLSPRGVAVAGGA